MKHKLTIKLDPAKVARGHRTIGRAATFADKRLKRQKTRAAKRQEWRDDR